MLVEPPRRSASGQILVLFVLGIVAVIAMTALIIEGGATFAQQRLAQNAADAAANAGTLVVAEKLGGATRTGVDVHAAVQSSTAANGLENPGAVYTDDRGVPLDPPAPVINSGEIPADARGVRVNGDRTVVTTLAGIIGINELRASAEATAIAGALSGGPLLPVTFPITVALCDGKDFLGIGGPDDIWQEISVDQRTAANEAIIPLCSIDPGSVGWLDLVPQRNLGQEILGPLDVSLDIPTWLQTQTGNVNGVEAELNYWADSPVLIPLFDGTCRVDPGDASSADTCPEAQRGTDPVGDNTWYHIPYFVTFWIDRAYVQGNNVDACASDPGEPKIDTSSPGFIGCIKGWFVKYVYNGPVGPGKYDPNVPSAIGIQLIK